jgi:hypothetical protein
MILQPCHHHRPPAHLLVRHCRKQRSPVLQQFRQQQKTSHPSIAPSCLRHLHATLNKPISYRTSTTNLDLTTHPLNAAAVLTPILQSPTMANTLLDIFYSLGSCICCFPSTPQLKINSRSFRMLRLLGEVSTTALPDSTREVKSDGVERLC